MATKTHRVANGSLVADHTVQFFDARDTLGAAVAHFLHDGLVGDGSVLVVAKPSSVQAIARALTDRGISLSSLVEAGRLMIVDAAAILQAVMDGNVPNPARFAAVVGTLVRQRCEAGRKLRIYGETMDLLAMEGNFTGAAALEALWSALLDEQPCDLMCGYLAAHFAGPQGVDALRAICATHSRVQQDHSDVLATWLLGNAAIT